MIRGFKVFTGSSHPDFAQNICNELSIPLSKAKVGKFSDGEISVQIGESVRGKDVFVVQPTGAPANDNLIELMIPTAEIKTG